jgi:NAD(P)-dependent dehydrogenase (short-subunit alcohol dehydrogenase family)
MTADLHGKRILITGSSRGMGRAAALACLDAGAEVFLTGSDPDELERTLGLTSAHGDRVAALAADLMDPAAVSGIVEAARAAFGGIDVLVNNAGIGVGAIRTNFVQVPIKFWTVTEEQYRRFIEINTISALRFAGLLAPEMIERGWGRIVSVTTSLNTMLMAGQAPYGVSKAGLEAITAIMAADLEGTGVTANVITSGGPAATRLVDGMGIPPEKLIPADCLAAPVVWLASNASDGVTARRYLGGKWDTALASEQAEAAAGSPIGWSGLGQWVNPTGQ